MNWLQPHLPGNEYVVKLGGREQVPQDPFQAQWDALTPEEQEAVLRIVGTDTSEEAAGWRLKTLKSSCYIEEPVSPEQFFEDPFYLGHVGNNLFPLLKDRICRILNDNQIREVILTGAIGWGKSFLASLAVTYEIYKLLCMREPMTLFGNHPGSPIVLTNLSVTGDNAKHVFYGYVYSYIMESPYFQEKRPPFKNKLWWPESNLTFRAGNSSENAIIGENVIGGVLDEANFMINARQTKRSKIAGEMDQAKVLYDALERRRASRFTLKDGGCIAKFWLISSKQFPGDFLETRIKQSAGDRSVAVLDYPMWVPRMSNPDHPYGESRFYVFLGNDAHKSRMIGDDAAVSEEDLGNLEIPEGCQIQAVPTVLSKFYRDDFNGSVRDFSGWAILAKSPYMEDPQKYRVCVAPPSGIPTRENVRFIRHLGDVPREHPFVADEPIGATLQTILKDRFPVSMMDRTGKVFDPVVDKARADEFSGRPTLNPDRPRFVHVDLGRGQRDGAAFAIGHFGGYLQVDVCELVGGDLYTFSEERPITIIDVMVRFYAPPNGKVEPKTIRDIIWACQSFGRYEFKLVTYDQWNSLESIDAFNAAGVVAQLHSVDRTDRAYGLLRQSYIDGRTSTYEYEPVWQDFSSLEKDYETQKIDHTGMRADGQPGTKDVADCVAAVHEHIEDMYATRRHPVPVKTSIMDGGLSFEDQFRKEVSPTVPFEEKRSQQPMRDGGIFDPFKKFGL